MLLYEHEAKQLLSSHGVLIPRGSLWPQVPHAHPPMVAKAQILGGARGLRGGVRRIRALEDLNRTVAELQGMSFDGQAVAEVLIEEWIEHERELYVGFVVSRDLGLPMLLASLTGGVAVNDSREVARLPVDPWTGPKGDDIGDVGRVLNADPVLIGPIIEALWLAFRTEDALLLEVNPLVLTPRGGIALDVRINLDENARFRHKSWPRPREGSRFEQECANFGAAAVELDGTIAVVTSGAGLAMASLDLLESMGRRARAVVDLGGLVFTDELRIAQVLRLVASLSPSLLLVNLFLQLASCDVVARGMLAAIQEGGMPHMVARLRGVGSEEAEAILGSAGVLVYKEMETAFEATVPV